MKIAIGQVSQEVVVVYLKTSPLIVGLVYFRDCNFKMTDTHP